MGSLGKPSTASQDAYYTNYATGSSQVAFSLSELIVPVKLLWLVVCCLFSIYSFYYVAPVSMNGGSIIWVCTTAKFWGISIADIYPLVLIHGSYQGHIKWIDFNH